LKPGPIEKPSAAEKFGSFAKRLLDSVKWKQKRSAKRDQSSLKQLNRAFENSLLSEIRPGDLRDYQTRRDREDMSAATINRERSLLVSILNAALADDLIAMNPISKLRGAGPLKEENGREQKILEFGLDASDFRRLIESADQKIKPIIEIALLTAMRRGEILTLRWSDIDLGARRLTIRAENAKSGKKREIPIEDDLLALLRSLKKRSVYLFPNPETGSHIKGISRSFKAAMKRAEIPYGRESGIVFHDLRHFAIWELCKRTDIVTASRIAGHSSIEITMRYVLADDESKRRGLEGLGDWLRGRQKSANRESEAAQIEASKEGAQAALAS
jgi:integrase